MPGVSDTAISQIQALGRGAASGAVALGHFQKQAGMVAGAVGLVVLAFRALSDWGKRSADAMQRMEDASRNFATIMGRSTFAEKLQAAQAEVAALTAQYKEMGGDQHKMRSGWWFTDMTQADKKFMETVYELDGAKDKLRLIKDWAEEYAAGAKGGIGGVADVGRLIQEALLNDEMLELTKKMADAMMSIDRKTSEKRETIGQ